MDFTKNLRTFIDVVFKSQRALASAMNITPQTLTPYITGNSKPGWEILTKLWNCGCSVDWLIKGEGEMFALNEAGDHCRQRFSIPTAKNKEITLSDAELLLQIPIIKEFKKMIIEEIKRELK
jgi:transcriptional regulator with XRE-family HTH domain